MLLVCELMVQSITEIRVLKSPPMVVESPFAAFSSVDFCFMYFDVLILSTCAYILLWFADELVIYHYKMSLFILVQIFVQKLLFSNINTVKPAFLCLPLTWCIFSIHSLSTYLWLVLKVLLLQPHIVRIPFKSYPTIYFLFGMFGPLTLNVMVDLIRYKFPCTILLFIFLMSLLFFVCLFFLSQLL